MPTAPAHTRLVDETYILKVYIAAPGTPIQPPGSNSPRGSLVGHVYYSVSDGAEEKGYGFSPIKSGTRGPGHVVRDEHLAYQNPAYIRTMEISEAQYEALRTYGERALNGDERHFKLQYDGATNSCIDFTWGALNHAGLHLEVGLPLGRKLRDEDYNGAIKPLDNIREFRRIPDPVPDSPHNREQENDLPERKLWQHLISEDDLRRDPSRHDARHAAATPDMGQPFDDPVLNRMHAALLHGDGAALDEIGRQFNRSEDGMRLAEQDDQLYAAHQAHAQREQQQDDALVRM